MEEDIKILKDLIKDFKDVDERTLYVKEVQARCKKRIKAIENILNRLEQDERVIEEMAECINNLGWSDLDNNKDIIEHFRKKCE